MTAAKVLLIEDSRVDRMMIQALLSKAGGKLFEVATTETLSDALEMIAQGSFDVILSDLMLPDSRGLDTFISVYKAAGDVPVVVLTGSDDLTLAAKAVEEGAEAYLVKGKIDGNRLARALPLCDSADRRRAVRVAFADVPAGQTTVFEGRPNHGSGRQPA